jgi:hypothetical protein
MTWDSGGLPGVGGGALTADVVTSINVTNETEVTNHPVETGVEISDHVIVKPDRVVFEFAQSTQPLRTEETEWVQTPMNVRDSQFQPEGLLLLTMAAEMALAAIGSAVGLLGGGGLDVWTLTAKDSEDRIHALRDKLIEVQQAPYLVTFSYQGLLLPNFVLTRVQYSRDGGRGGLARFTLEAQQITTVATASADLGGLGGLGAVTAVLAAVPLLDLGAKSVEKVEKEVIKKSLLASGLDSLGL